jgi:hypothetical protein
MPSSPLQLILCSTATFAIGLCMVQDPDLDRQAVATPCLDAARCSLHHHLRCCYLLALQTSVTMKAIFTGSYAALAQRHWTALGVWLGEAVQQCELFARLIMAEFVGSNI